MLISKLTVPIELMNEYALWNSFLDRCVPHLKFVRIEEPIDSSTNYKPADSSMFLSFFAHHARDLCELTLRGDYQIHCPLWEVLSRNCPHLRTLDIQGNAVFFGWDRIGVSAQLLSLASLRMGQTNLSDSDLVPLLNVCPNLQTLQIGQSNWITQSGVVSILNSQAPLKSIQIHGQYNYRIGATPPILRRRLELTNVSLSGAIADDFMLALSESCPALTHLSMSDNNSLTDAGILSISRACKEITNVSVRSCFDTSSGIYDYFSPAVRVYFEPTNVWLQFPDFTALDVQLLMPNLHAAQFELPQDDDL
eukprot:CAMPEP_0184971984 /NCGR_PEP_ID=MMETSP1098-20130426/4072_1 /TAXON_ID=89044 /ORGANISM="Spumella elongata, Strain CCAP 955/1" /LENGTH=307 /DNA_ID=CAMNT_0027494193 /DNA_START=289 /DNA_END=1212 /DNA_ORIENTATION=+